MHALYVNIKLQSAHIAINKMDAEILVFSEEHRCTVFEKIILFQVIAKLCLKIRR